MFDIEEFNRSHLGDVKEEAKRFFIEKFDFESFFQLRVRKYENLLSRFFFKNRFLFWKRH